MGRIREHPNGIANPLPRTPPIDGRPATNGNSSTIGFTVESAEKGDAWHAAGVANGGTTCEDPPGLRDGGIDLRRRSSQETRASSEHDLSDELGHRCAQLLEGILDGASQLVQVGDEIPIGREAPGKKSVVAE